MKKLKYTLRTIKDGEIAEYAILFGDNVFVYLDGVSRKNAKIIVSALNK